MTPTPHKEDSNYSEIPNSSKEDWPGLGELVRDMTLVAPVPMAKSEVRRRLQEIISQKFRELEEGIEGMKDEDYSHEYDHFLLKKSEVLSLIHKTLSDNH